MPPGDEDVARKPRRGRKQPQPDAKPPPPAPPEEVQGAAAAAPAAAAAAATAAAAAAAEADELRAASFVPLPAGPPEPASSGADAAPVDVQGAGVPLTRYERTQVIGIRAEQLARGALAFVDTPVPSADSHAPPVSMYDIAERELAAGKLPFIVVRHMPDGSKQHLRLSRAPGAAA